MNDTRVLTLRDLIQNPAGWNTRHVGARYMIRDALIAKYKESMADPKKRKKYAMSVTKVSPGIYTVWVKVPSEKLDITYDVIFRLRCDSSPSVMNAKVQLFCNSPGWIFPVGYVAAKRGILIPGWEKALGLAAKQPPDTLNPKQDYGMDKTSFRAVLYMTGAGGLLTIADMDRVAGGQPPDPNDPTMSGEAKLLEYKAAMTRHSAMKQLDRKIKKENKLEDQRAQRAEKRRIRKTNAAKSVAAVKAAKSSKASEKRKGK